MSAGTPPTGTAELRRRHHAEERRPTAEYDARGDLINEADHRLICRRCRQTWPCDAATLLDRLEALEKALKYLADDVEGINRPSFAAIVTLTKLHSYVDARSLLAAGAPDDH